MENIENKGLPERLEIIKHHFKLNDVKLAAIAGVSSTAIGYIINGETDNPKLSLVKNICKNLNISLDWLAFGEGEMLRSSNNNSNSYSNISQSNDNEVGFLRGRVIELESMLKLALTSLGKFDVSGLHGVNFFYSY